MADLTQKIDQTLTEARMVLPGTQALLGFQLIAMLTERFAKLPLSSRYAHLASLSLCALAAIWLMTPAAWHRLVERGEDSERFHALASRFLLMAMVVLAAGISADYFVVARELSGSLPLAVGASLFLTALFYGMWFALPLATRRLTR